MTPRSSSTALWPVLAFTACSSFAAGTATLSVFFVTARAPYEFGAARQYALGLLVGLTYMGGALLAGEARRWAARLGLSARTFLGALALAMGLLMLVPTVTSSALSVFVLLAVYAPLTGLFWPLVESYVSGGRKAGELRSAIGRFNIVWSVTLLPSFLLPPLIEDRPALVFVAVAVTHFASLACLSFLRPDPAEHASEEAHAVPAAYPELLRVHRVLHAVSYLVMYALSPYLPTVLARIGIDGRARGAVAAVWLAARTLTFGVLERWHGWHGRWFVASAGTLLVLGGFALTVLAPGAGASALPLVIGALFAFGVGLAALYTAALYYAFEVGGHEGGGSHEALIGLGYSIGPSCGLFVCALEGGGAITSERRDVVLLAVITALCVLGALYAAHRPSGASAGEPRHPA